MFRARLETCYMHIHIHTYISVYMLAYVHNIIHINIQIYIHILYIKFIKLIKMKKKNIFFLSSCLQSYDSTITEKNVIF